MCGGDKPPPWSFTRPPLLSLLMARPARRARWTRERAVLQLKSPKRHNASRFLTCPSQIPLASTSGAAAPGRSSKKITNSNSALGSQPLSSQELPWKEGGQGRGSPLLLHCQRPRGAEGGHRPAPLALDSWAQPLGLHRASPGEPAWAAWSAAESATTGPRGQCGRSPRRGGELGGAARCCTAAAGRRRVKFPGPRWAMPPDSALRRGPCTCKLSPAHMLHIKAPCPVPSCFFSPLLLLLLLQKGSYKRPFVYLAWFSLLQFCMG